MEKIVEAVQPQLAKMAPSSSNLLHMRSLGGRAPLISPVVRRLCSPAVRVADLVSLTLALLVTMFAASAENASVAGFFRLRFSVMSICLELLLLVVWRFIFWMAGVYQPRLNRIAAVFLWRVPVTMVGCTLALTPLVLLNPEPMPDVIHAAFIFWFAGTTLMFATRAGYYTYDEHVRPALRPRRNIVVVGTGPRARMMTGRLADHPDYKYQLCGFVDTNPQPECESIAPMLGGIDDLENVLMHQPIDEVMIALPIKSSFSDVQEVVAVCGRMGIKTQYSLDLFTTDVAKHQETDEATGVRVMEMVHNDQRLFVKNAIDRAGALLGLVFLSPLMLLIALAVKLTSKGPVFFIQERWGRNKRTFGMIKFRSMVVDAEAQQAELEQFNENNGAMFKMRRDPRITKIGRFIRRTSLDELPQLINVLMGEMSLVGPRPLPNRDVAKFSEAWLMRRFSVKPGITGLWQVSGRSNTDFDETIQLDLRYIDRWSLWLDLKILAQTLQAVVKGSGAF